MIDSLKNELETFGRHKADLLKDVGKYALVKGDVIAGVYDTYADAIRKGYKQFGLESFLVKQILPAQFDRSAIIFGQVNK